MTRRHSGRVGGYSPERDSLPKELSRRLVASHNVYIYPFLIRTYGTIRKHHNVFHIVTFQVLCMDAVDLYRYGVLYNGAYMDGAACTSSGSHILWGMGI